MISRVMKTAFIRIEAEDVGMTQAVQIFIGETPIVRFVPGTRDARRALAYGEQVVMHALRPLLLAQLENEHYREVADDYVVNDPDAVKLLEQQMPPWTKLSPEEAGER